jgi:hypothetical protein
MMLAPPGTRVPPWPDEQLPWSPDPPPGFPTSPAMTFKVERQPAAAGETMAAGMNSDVLQMPGETAVDLAASGNDQNPTQFNPDTNGDGTPDDVEPVVIIFSPNGNVDRVCQGGVQSRITEPLYLLIGRRERMIERTSDLLQLVSDEDGLPNWLDPENLWLAVNPQSGLVYVAQNNYFDPAAPSTFSYGDPAQRQAAFAVARRFAREGQVVGGR